MTGKIQHITFKLTNRCNLHCRICNIWRERPIQELPLGSVRRMLNDFPCLSSVSLTGGEPFLHPGISAFYRYLYSLWMKRKLRNIDIATNAGSPALPSFLKKHQDFLAPLSLSISLDGLDDIHDIQRGTRGAFAHVIKNVRAAKACNIPVTLKFVASALNYHQLPHVARLAKDMDCRFGFKLIEKVPAYYHRARSGQLPLLRRTHKKALAKLLEEIPLDKNSDALEVLSFTWHKKYLRQGNLNFIRRCLTPERSLFVTAHGNIYNCLYMNKIGTLETWPEAIKVSLARANKQCGLKGKCPKCLSYHGSIKTYHLH